MLTNIAWLGLVVCSGLRMASYIPQLWRMLMDKTAAPTTTYTTWALWTCTNLSTTFYAAVSLNDLWLTVAGATYASCGMCAMVLKAIKRL